MVTTRLSVVDSKGQALREVELPKAILERKVKPSVVHQVVVGYGANRRAGTAHTKDRSEVSGGGKKPWKQKGTGRARQGSIRSPQWKGGGVVFGPRNTRNYKHRLTDQLKETVLSMVVADALRSGRVTVVDQFPTEVKTKVFASLLKAVKPTGSRRCLVLLTEGERELRRGLTNLPQVEVMGVRQLNPYDGLNTSRWMVSSAGLTDLLKLVS